MIYSITSAVRIAVAVILIVFFFIKFEFYLSQLSKQDVDILEGGSSDAADFFLSLLDLNFLSCGVNINPMSVIFSSFFTVVVHLISQINFI